MKIAICLSGIPNITEEFKKHFYEAIHTGEHEFDLYAHSWGSGREQDLIFDFGIQSRAVVEEQRPFFIPIGLRESVPPQNVFAQLYTVSKSFEYALESGVEYDFYVRCRFDVFVGNPIDYNSLDKNKCWMLPLGKLQPPRTSNEYIDNIGILPLPKDFFWICNKDVAKVSSTLFENIVDYNLNQSIMLCPEDLIFHHFGINNVDIALLENNKKNGLYRQNHHHGDGLVFYNEKGPYQDEPSFQYIHNG